jgi:CBS domain-containing protein
MRLVSQILQSKGHDVWFVGPQTTVFDAVKLMSEKGVGALLVMENKKMVGIISERDYARKVILEGKSSRQTPVTDVMTKRVLRRGPSKSAWRS